MYYEGKGIGESRPNRLSRQKPTLKFNIYAAYKTNKGAVGKMSRWRLRFNNVLLATGSTFESVKDALIEELRKSK
jgi:hypothetical protein